MSLTRNLAALGTPLVALLFTVACASQPRPRISTIRLGEPIAEDETRVAGVVDDSDGWLRGAVTIEAVSADTKEVFTLSDGVGHYRLEALPPTYYDLSFRVGNITVHKPRILVLPGKETRVNVKLPFGRHHAALTSLESEQRR